MFRRDERDVAASSGFRLEKLEMLDAEGVARRADDCAVVREEAEGMRKPCLAGVAEKLAREPSDSSGCEVDALEMSACDADI